MHPERLLYLICVKFRLNHSQHICLPSIHLVTQLLNQAANLRVNRPKNRVVSLLENQVDSLLLNQAIYQVDSHLVIQAVNLL